MDTTDCLELPYPQCEPPLVKDASDIEQFENLAQAADAAVQAYADLLDTTLINPDAVIMTGGVTTAGRDVIHFFATSVFDNAGMADTVADGVRFVRSGWYMIGGHVNALSTSASGTGMRVEPLRNGDTFSARQGPGRPTLPLGSFTDDVAWTDVAFFNAGDFLNVMSHHADSAALSITYTTRIWALLVAANV